MIDYDYDGHCATCHKDMRIEQVVGGKVIKRRTPDYAEVQFLLNDGSKMSVAICKQCQEKNLHTNFSDIMNCVINGWQKEVNDLIADEKKPQWTEKKGRDYMGRYKTLKILADTKGQDEDSLNKVLKEAVKEGVQ